MPVHIPRKPRDPDKLPDGTRLQKLKDPVVFAKVFWPKVKLYREQREVLWSFRDSVETYVPAGNMLGKDFLGGIGALWAVLVHPVVRVVTTSVADDHLDVLWGEIGRFIDTAVIPLRKEDGGPLVVNHHHVRKLIPNPTGRGKPVVDKISYLKGMVAAKGEKLAGHHAPATFGIMDEASGIEDVAYTQMMTWCKRLLAIFNCNPCVNFVKRAVEAGDLVNDADDWVPPSDTGV